MKVNETDIFSNEFLQKWIRENLEDGQRAKVFGTVLTKYYNIHKKVWLDATQGNTTTELSFITSSQWIIVPTANQIENFLTHFCQRNDFTWNYGLRNKKQNFIVVYDSDYNLVYTTHEENDLHSATPEETRLIALGWVCNVGIKTLKYKL
ncbi:hypothetical protein IT568_09590 [bacterium]|nr:hypothetical protein [bacterium]